MNRDYRVLLIGQKAETFDHLTHILDFLGEPVVSVLAENWDKQLLKKQTVLAVIFCDDLLAPTPMLNDIIQISPATPIIYHTNDDAKLAVLPAEIRQHILDTLRMPYSYETLMTLLHRCQIAQEYDLAVNNAGENRPVVLFRSLVGTSRAIQTVRHLLQQVAGSDATVLILGESGTGKEVVARNLHYHSARAKKKFVPVNCGAIPAELLESELFGHEKGAFTGAITAREGRFQMAEGGTLFLDEIGDMPLSMQVKLLRVLQEHCFERVGSNVSIPSDVRIIAATHRNLETEIEAGRFREDLYYRLNVFPIETPALRERIDDLPMLIHELITRIESTNRPGVRFLPEALSALSEYAWPGNVRELANLVERLAILYPNGLVDAPNLPRKFLSDARQANLPESPPPVAVADAVQETVMVNPAEVVGALPRLSESGIDLKEHLEQTERALIHQALQACEGIVARAANFLHLRRTTLVEKMKKYGMAAKDE